LTIDDFGHGRLGVVQLGGVLGLVFFVGVGQGQAEDGRGEHGCCKRTEPSHAVLLFEGVPHPGTLRPGREPVAGFFRTPRRSGRGRLPEIVVTIWPPAPAGVVPPPTTTSIRCAASGPPGRAGSHPPRAGRWKCGHSRSSPAASLPGNPRAGSRP